MGSHKSKDDETYEAGVHDGQKADLLDQTCHSLSKGFSVIDPRRDEIYNKGYDYGVSHQSDSESDSSGSPSGGSSGGPCLVSTACVSAAGLSDECHELTVLRGFRDGYVRTLPNGPNMIGEYYDLAPRVLTALRLSPYAKDELRRLYTSLVLPAVAFIERHEPRKAFDLYQSSIIDLRRRFLNV
jgi:hypothetical protein